MGHLFSARTGGLRPRSPADWPGRTRPPERRLCRNHDFSGRDAAAHAKRGSKLRRHSRSRRWRALPPSSYRMDIRCCTAVRRPTPPWKCAMRVQVTSRGRDRVWYGRRRTFLSRRAFSSCVRSWPVAKACGSVCHAGEIGGPESVREAVEILGAERIGHGIAVMHDEALAGSLAHRRVVLEMCPSSNLATGALAKQTGKPDASLADHPLRKLHRVGLARDPIHRRSGDVSYRSARGIFSRRIARSIERAVAATRRAELQRGVFAADRQTQTSRGFSRRGQGRGPA